MAPAREADPRCAPRRRPARRPGRGARLGLARPTTGRRAARVRRPRRPAGAPARARRATPGRAVHTDARRIALRRCHHGRARHGRGTARRRPVRATLPREDPAYRRRHPRRGGRTCRPRDRALRQRQPVAVGPLRPVAEVDREHRGLRDLDVVGRPARGGVRALARHGRRVASTPRRRAAGPPGRPGRLCAHRSGHGRAAALPMGQPPGRARLHARRARCPPAARARRSFTARSTGSRSTACCTHRRIGA